MGITVNAQAGSIVNNYDIHDNEVVNVGISGEVHETPEIHSEDRALGKEPTTWEEAIPEWLQTGKRLKAWNELRKSGILDDDYRLVDGSKAEAHFLVTCFCMERENNTWKPFENFWGFTDLKHGEGAFRKEQENIISEIFRNL